ncbi:glutamate-cysteine ligase family protein, partial [Promicromonospora kroppenstedtii]|uniref:glutamate-cysteine ligase family protein n=1 Tax=Promicromonospora kroppenstedtii TaxID=440482 RepID=UPI00056BB68D
MTTNRRTVGVEEELMLVGQDGAPIARARDVLGTAEPDDGPLEHEFMEEQIETATPPRSTLEDVAAAIREGRAGAQ